MSDRDVLELDCLVVGAGPAGLAAAIRFKDLATEAGKDLEIAVLEKGSAPGVHSLSGAVVDPRGLDDLLPGWRDMNPPVEAKVGSERFYALSSRRAYRMPVPPPMHNKGNFVCSLNKLSEWLAGIAEERGIEVYPEFPARDLLIEDGKVTGVRLVDSGVGKDGEHKASYAPGADLKAKVTILCDGVRGNLTKAADAPVQPDILRGPQRAGLRDGHQGAVEGPAGLVPGRHRSSTRSASRCRRASTAARGSTAWARTRSASAWS